MILKLSRDRFSWFVSFPWWPYSGRFLSAKNAREWAKRDGHKLIRAKHEDKPD
jgi:hypothetical protein